MLWKIEAEIFPNKSLLLPNAVQELSVITLLGFRNTLGVVGISRFHSFYGESMTGRL